MGFSMNVEQLIHEAVDAKNGQINQYFLVKLLEIIVRQSNIQTLNVDFTENDKEQGCELSKSFELQSINKEPLEEKILNSHVVSIVSGINISTTDIQDNSTLTCSSVDSFEESLESIYKPLPEEIISELELIEEEVDKISTPSTLSLNQFLEKKHEYFLHNNDQRVIAELIEKLFAKIKKVDDATKHLMKSIKPINLEDSESSPDSEIDAFKKIAISDMGSPFEIEKYGYDPFKLDENLKNLEISAKGEAFREIFGATQKIKDLHSNLTILNFREFDLEYRTNFRTIQTFIELHKELLHKANSNIKELQNNCLNNDYRKFKKDVLLRLTKIEDDIKKYIARDPEAMGIARFIKDGACVSCATPARMKITNTAPISAGKDAHTRNSFKMYTKSILLMALAYICLSYCTTEDDGRMNVIKPTVDKVREVIQSVSGVGGSYNTPESNSAYANPVKPSIPGTAVPQPGSPTTIKPVTTSGYPEKPTQTYQPDSCSCSYSVENFCQG
ncbi:hypothetical protein QTP88_006257 [Uroleucon formosanum]